MNEGSKLVGFENLLASSETFPTNGSPHCWGNPLRNKYYEVGCWRYKIWLEDFLSVVLIPSRNILVNFSMIAVWGVIFTHWMSIWKTMTFSTERSIEASRADILVTIDYWKVFERLVRDSLIALVKLFWPSTSSFNSESNNKVFLWIDLDGLPLWW